MTKGDRAQRVMETLSALYPETPIPLDHSNEFTLLIAVLLSAQCTDERVNKVTPELFVLADNSKDMSKVSVNKIKAIIRPCGLSPRKSKNIKDLSILINTKHGGEVPSTFEELEALPGVGHKTASVVMSQAFGVPAFPVDTHIHRLAQRWGFTSGKNVKQTEADLKKIFPIDNWNKLHLQMIFYGREYCTARGCDGTICPMCQELYPNRKAPKKIKKA